MSPGVMNINRTLNESYIPKLRLLTSRGDGYKGLSASPMYASGFNDKVCVYTNNTDYGWSQPILIM
jgi:hypothetical protein